MHYFKLRKQGLCCEKASVENLAKKFGTPLYIYSSRTLSEHYTKLKNAFKAIRPLICFSVKANSNLAILRSLVAQGAGLDIVSGGELYRALKAGCPPERIVYASVGKTIEEIRAAIKARILFFNVESLPELETINNVAKSLKKKVRVAIRVNPDVSPKTHKFITTGKSINKFGIDFATAFDILQCHRYFSAVDICGLHVHIGSQITEGTAFVQAIKKVQQFLNKLNKKKIHLKYLNIGGGLGIVYDKEKPQTAAEFAYKVLPLLKKTGLKVILEPGRFIVGNAGILVAKVLYIKKTAKKKFIIIDAAMNDLMRPALYSAYHKIVPVAAVKNGLNGVEKYDVVGPICESGDFLAKDRDMPELEPGDFIAVMSCGAYGFSMSSNYNSRFRAAEVMVSNDRIRLIRKRETNKDLIKNEVIPRALRCK